MAVNSKNFSTYGSKPPGLNGQEVGRFMLASPFGPNPNAEGLDMTTAPGVLAALRDAWELTRQGKFNGRRTSDEFYGLVVFGSLVKGRFHARSDIDGTLLHRLNAGHAVTHVEAIEQSLYTDMSRKGYTHGVDLEYHPVNVPLDLTVLRQSLRAGRLEGDQRKESINDGTVALFQLSVGTSEVPVLRSRFLDGLMNTDGGDTIWRAIAAEMIEFEEFRRGGKIILPDTASEAKLYFESIQLEQQLRGTDPITYL